MKMVKMEDEVHSRLKAMSDGDTTMSQVVEGLLGGTGSRDDGVDRILDQIGMIHTRFDALEDSLSSLSFSEPKEDTYLSPAEARQKEIERLRAMDEFQQNAISHPEDEVQ